MTQSSEVVYIPPQAVDADADNGKADSEPDTCNG